MTITVCVMNKYYYNKQQTDKLNPSIHPFVFIRVTIEKKGISSIQFNSTAYFFPNEINYYSDDQDYWIKSDSCIKLQIINFCVSFSII